MMTLKFNDEVLGATAALEITREHDAEHWHLTLQVQAATTALIEQALDGLRGAIGATGDLALSADGTEVRQLSMADCRIGPVFVGLHELDPAPGDAHGTRRARLTFKATRQDPDSAVQQHNQTVSVSSDVGAAQRLRYQGLAILRRGENPAAYEAVLLPAVQAGYRRVQSSTTRDAAEPSLDYTVEDEQVFTPLPAGVEDGHYAISETVGADGTLVRTVAGFFIGPGALAQAHALAGGGERVIRENPFTRRVDFEFREAVAGASGHVALAETLAFTTSRRVVDHPLLAAGAPAWRQEIGAAQTRIIQQGSAIGDGRHASPPAPRYLADLLERHVDYSVPHPWLPPQKRWVTSWRYESRTRGAALHKVPETP
ncbi:MAG: hypothetical protein IPK87_14610 [Planctomycetes bacterium]|nr:hypothetical protein [Planctomycetota bacterium]